ncbi:MAG: hypothetical protein KY464_08630 [Gemmatimonadetes bacterium]|nr:hypothetical protein [Gemmatimonadota bacterium]
MMSSIRLSVGALAATCATLCLAPLALAQSPASDAVTKQVSALQSRCGSLAGEKRTSCFDSELLALLKQAGVGATMTVLERLGEADRDVRREGHLYAHSIGLAAFRGRDEVGATFSECTPIFQSGCYHGVIQSYFADLVGSSGPEAVTADAVNQLCGSYRGDPGKRWILFQCVHGMGHGLAMVHQHHLPRMLGGCDLLREAWEREGCYGGAFMENVVQATAPHHTVGRPEAGGAHGHDPAGNADVDHAAMGHTSTATPSVDHAAMGHTAAEAAAMDHAAMGHGAPAGEPYKALDKNDPLYPCNTLDVRYLRSCYSMQTSAILFFNGGDVPATARACDGAPEDFRTACYQSLGRDISAYTLQDHAKAAQLCENGDPAYQPWCHVGYTKNLVDLNADATDGIAYCRILTSADAKVACYRAVGEETWVLTNDREKHRAWCDTAEAEYRATCAAAAGVNRPGNREQGRANSLPVRFPRPHVRG